MTKPKIGLLTVILFTAHFSVAYAQSKQEPMKFDFGSGKVASGYTQVLPNSVYDKEKGFGLEPGANVTCPDRGGKNNLRSDLCTSDKPFYFSVAVPEGNYRVTITFGDAKAATSTVVKAELRRLMLESADTAKG